MGRAYFTTLKSIIHVSANDWVGVPLMEKNELKELQAPLKERYKADPQSALVTLKAEGRLGEGLTCNIATGRALVEAGLHPATGGNGQSACSGDMLLQALVACAGVTLHAVATSMGIEVIGGQIVAEGDLDFRGTLGVVKDVPVGLQAIRLRVHLENELDLATRQKLLELTARYCVVYQTLRHGADLDLAYGP